MKYICLLVFSVLIASCDMPSDNNQKNKTSQEKIEAIKKKPYNELTKEEKDILILILKSDN